MSELQNNKTFVFLSRACVVLLLICLVFNLCVMPSFAYSDDLSYQPICNNPSSGADVIASGIYYYNTANIYFSPYVYNNSNVYLVSLSNNSCVWISDNTFSRGGWARSTDNVNWELRDNDISVSSFSYSDTYGLYYLGNAFDRVPSSNIVGVPCTDTLDEALALVAGSIVEPLPTGNTGDVVIPAGWVSYIQVSGGNMLLETTFPEYSNIIGTPPWNSRSTISYGVSSLPVEGTVFSETSGTLINWAKSTQGKNILGQTKQAGYGVNNLEQSQNYIVIYNPANRQVSERGQGDISPTITAHFTELIEAKSYPLTQTFNIGTGETTSTSVSGYDNPLTTTPEGTTDTNGNPSTPNIGGSGADASYNDWSVTNYLQSIKETLDNFASNFMGLLQSPISHVRQLIAAGSDYFQVIQGLYAWLPSPVQSTIESALIVSISIGVIGLLL